MINRDNIIKLIQAARLANRHDFASAAAADWLALWPGDLEVQFIIAQTEMDQLHHQPAIQRLIDVVTADPEYVEAYDLLSAALHAAGEPTRARIYAACAETFRGAELNKGQYPSWAIHLNKALSALNSDAPKIATSESQKALTADPDLPLIALVAMRAQLAAGDRPAALMLARTGHDRWPECLAFRLLLADEFLSQGEVRRGVEYFHQAASDDPTGRVTDRILGPSHPYRSLWPTQLKTHLNRPVPAIVAAVLGDNRLASGSLGHVEVTTSCGSEQPKVSQDAPQVKKAEKEPTTAYKKPEETSLDIGVPPLNTDDSLPVPEPWESFQGPDPGDDVLPEHDQDDETLLEIERDFNRLAARVNPRQRYRDEDKRVPAYIILSSHTRLIQAFGDDCFQRIDQAIMSLVESVRRRSGWTAYRLYIDDPNTFEPFGLSPADPANAWQIKLRLADLDQALGRRGEMIGALLIVGGDRIVPFHLLPNPTDDDDEIIPSDNPYATTDENYFIPEWAIGRLPSADDPDFLVRLLRSYADEHRVSVKALNPLLRFRIWLATKFGRLFRHTPRTLGYSASIWRKASLAVYKVIGDPGSMLTSPPTEADRLPPIATRPAKFSYFNLHGLEDAPEWFGQKDPVYDEGTGPEFPIAIRPQDVVNNNNAPKIIFTEACYGANILGKTSQSSLCLKFLDAGSRAVIGSTKISYGSLTTPLIAADLLGRLFWEYLNQPLPVGEALRRAKLKLAADMHRRQGFLDGEDQKTLISFVLYGDPLHCPTFVNDRPGQKMVIRRTTRPEHLKTVCSLGGSCIDTDTLDPADLKRVKAIVSQYLPGMADAQCHIHHQHHGCNGSDHLCPTYQLGIKNFDAKGRDNLVVTFSKHVRDGALQHPHFARLTLDPTGKVLKLAVSR